MSMDVQVSKSTINGKNVLCVTSLQVAEAFGKRHDNVLADIRKIIEADDDGFALLNFQEYLYANENNREMSTMFTGVHHV